MPSHRELSPSARGGSTSPHATPLMGRPLRLPIHGIRVLLLGSLASGAVAPSPVAALPPSSGLMTLVGTDRVLSSSGDPIWELRLEIPGQKLRRFDALVGRAASQQSDRQRLGSRSPLPPGPYQVTDIEPVQPGDDPQLGRFLWIGLEPLFPTGRRGLGIHHDPSAGRGRQSGTDGCIGLIHGNDLLVLSDLIQRHGTRDLVVLE
jgi:hypothetical protein